MGFFYGENDDMRPVTDAETLGTNALSLILKQTQLVQIHLSLYFEFIYANKFLNNLSLERL